jgi:hypothetical protein
MSLTKQDLKDIHGIVIEAFETLSTPRFDEIDQRFDEVDKRFDRLEGRVGSLEVGVGGLTSGQRETNQRLDKMIADIAKSAATDKRFSGFSTEKKLLSLNAEILALAKKLGISLPR